MTDRDTTVYLIVLKIDSRNGNTAIVSNNKNKKNYQEIRSKEMTQSIRKCTHTHTH